MRQNINVDVHHVTRVEGHGNIKVKVVDGVIKQCDWIVPEAPRFFEALVRGRHYSEVSRIVSRICGICSVGHSLVSLKAVEDAMGIEVSPQTVQLRKLLKMAENFDSHVLHIYVLAAPDLAGAPSAFALLPDNAELVQRALRLKRLAHEWGCMLAGRTTHPTSIVPGGFSSVPTVRDLQRMRDKLAAALPDLEATVDTVKALAGAIPPFSRPTEYMALGNVKGYGLYDGYVETILPDGDRAVYGVGDYRKCTNEYMDPRSTAKYTKNRMDSYQVGALARLNVNYDLLAPEAKRAAEKLGIAPICTNPYFNTVAQVVEVVHMAYEGLRILDELIADGIVFERPGKPTRYGVGHAAVEVPRGLLFHEYAFDKDGYCVAGDIVIPTNENHGNIQRDFDALVPWLMDQDKTEDETRLALEMLVRAYDPCISCSTH